MDTHLASVPSSSSAWSRSPDTLVGRLNREWDGLCGDSGANAEAERWSRESAPLFGLHSLPLIEKATQGPVDARVDAIFHALVGRAVSADHGADLAARIVLQRMLGKVVLIARAHAEILADRDERFQLAVACMYEAIRTFPISRRSHHVPPYLAWTTHSAVRRAVRAQTAEIPVGTLSGVALGLAGLHPSEELSHLLAWATAERIISSADAELLAARYGSEQLTKATWRSVGDLEVIAHSSGMSPDAVKQRCSRARRRLSAVAPAYLQSSGEQFKGGYAVGVTLRRCSGFPRG